MGASDPRRGGTTDSGRENQSARSHKRIPSHPLRSSAGIAEKRLDAANPTSSEITPDIALFDDPIPVDSRSLRSPQQTRLHSLTAERRSVKSLRTVHTPESGRPMTS